MRPRDYLILIAAAAVLFLGSFVIGVPQDKYYGACELLKAQDCSSQAINTIIALSNSNGNYTLGNLCAAGGYRNSTTCAKSCGCILTGTDMQLSSVPVKTYSDRPFVKAVSIVEDGL